MSRSRRFGAIFPHPSSMENVYVILDPCHMFKLIRNTLAKRGNLIDGNENVISWSYFIKLVELQENEGLHLGTKIRRHYIFWEQEKMKVSLAAQTLSNSVAVWMKFCREKFKNPDFLHSAATSQFCLYINNIFDLLSSRNLFSKTTRQCITPKNLDDIKVQVNKWTYLSSLSNQGGPILNSSCKTGFLGMIISLKSVVCLAEALFKDENFTFFTTYKLSQDHIETFFSAIRSRGGFNDNPTA